MTTIILPEIMKIKQMIVKENDVDILKNIWVLKMYCIKFLNESLFY
jgi:hypothetical protein